jgi:hypothetical protein
MSDIVREWLLIFKTIFRLSSVAGVLFVSLAAVCQPPAPQKPVEELKVVSLDGNHLRVQVNEPSTLTKVFKAVCMEQKLDCTGADSLASYPVPKMEAEGTLREVVDNLLQGTGVNYRYTRATTATKAQLVLLGHAPQGNNAALPARGNRENAPPPPLRPIPYPGGSSNGVTTGATDPNQSQSPPPR